MIDPDGMSQSDVEMLRRRGCMDAQNDATMNAYDAVMRDKANEDAARDAQFWGSAGLNGDQAARLSGGNARVGAMVDGMHAAATSAGQYDAFSAEYGTAWAGAPNYEAFKGFYKRNRAGSDGGGDDDGYGSTFSERVTNPELWKKIGSDFLFGPDDSKVVNCTMADNPISFFLPLGQLSKATLGYKTLGGASKTTMVTSAFFKEMGVSGSMGGRWFTPLGNASNWETFFGRWTPFLMESGLIYDYFFNDSDDK